MPLEMPKFFIENIFRGWKSKKSKLISIITSKQTVIDTSVLEISASEIMQVFFLTLRHGLFLPTLRTLVDLAWKSVTGRMNFEKFWLFSNDDWGAKVSVLANRGASHKLFLGGVKCQEYAREKPGIRKQIHNYDHFYAPNPTISVVVYACEVLTQSAGWYVLFLVRLILVKCGARRALWPDKTEKKDNWIIKQFEYKHSERVPEYLAGGGPNEITSICITK